MEDRRERHWKGQGRCEYATDRDGKRVSNRKAKAMDTVIEGEARRGGRRNQS